MVLSLAGLQFHPSALFIRRFGAVRKRMDGRFGLQRRHLIHFGAADGISIMR
jgi:hypothetical protein